MKKRRLIGGLLFVLAMVGVVLLLFWIKQHYNPDVYGRSRPEWTRIFEETDNPEERQEAAEALIEALRVTRGPNRVYAVKPLALWVSENPDKQLNLPPEAALVLGDALKDKNGAVRYYSLAVLQHMGPKAKEAVPAILEMLNDPHSDDRGYAAKVLWKIDPEAAAKAGQP